MIFKTKKKCGSERVDISNQMRVGGSVNIAQITEEIKQKCLDMFNKGTEKELLALNGVGKKKSNKVFCKREEEGFVEWKTLSDALEYIGFSAERQKNFLQKMVMDTMFSIQGNTIQFGNKTEVEEPKDDWAGLADINI